MRWRRTTPAPISAGARHARLRSEADKDATESRETITSGLHAAGFDDKAILQITLIASWFNYINRVADALGVGRGSSA